MMRVILLSVWVLSTAVAQQDFPLCEVCGCPTCEPGLYPVGALNGLIPIPPGLESVSPEDFTQISCSFLEFLGSNGQISPEICDSGFRLEPSFRSACDCPLLPGFTAMPTNAPVTMAPTTASPTLSPTPPPPTEAPTSFIEALEFCSDDGQVNFNDDLFFDVTNSYNLLVHADAFKPTCSCTADTNVIDVYLYLQEAFYNGDVSELPEINARVASIDHSIGFSCTNECSVCFSGICAIVNNAQDQRAVGAMPNFTPEELTPEFFESDELFERMVADPGYMHNTATCATFVSGAEGEICLQILEWTDIFPNTFPPSADCDITVNGVSCSTCLATGKDFGSPCIRADCTNIENGEVIDTCNGQTSSDVYQAIALFTNPDSYFGLLESDCITATPAPVPPITEAPTPTITEPPQEPLNSPLPTTQAPTESPENSPTSERCRRFR